MDGLSVGLPNSFGDKLCNRYARTGSFSGMVEQAHILVAQAGCGPRVTKHFLNLLLVVVGLQGSMPSEARGLKVRASAAVQILYRFCNAFQ